jgi:hypothetical protein
MNKFRNGDVALVGLQPYFDEYALIRYIDYHCYFPWLTRNRDIFFIYNFLVKEPDTRNVPDLDSLEYFCNPIPAKYWGVPDQIHFIRNSPIMSTKEVPHLFFKNSGLDHRLLKYDPLTVNIPSRALIFYTGFGHFAPNKINSNEIINIEFDELFISEHIDIRIALELMKVRAVPLTNIYEKCYSDYTKDAKIIYVLGKETEKFALPSDLGIEYFFDLPERFSPFEYYNREEGEDFLIYFHDIKLIEKFHLIFTQNGFIANRLGWLMLFDHLSENRTKYDFDYNDHYYKFDTEADLIAFEAMIIKTTDSPDFVAKTLDEIPLELREKYFPSTPNCKDEETEAIEYVELKSPSEFLDIHRSITGTKKEYIINLDVDKLFDKYRDAFAKKAQYANGYGWEEIIVTKFFPHKVVDSGDTMQPMLDAEGGALAIIFKKKSDCTKSAQHIADFLSDEGAVMKALELNIN